MNTLPATLDVHPGRVQNRDDSSSFANDDYHIVIELRRDMFEGSATEPDPVSTRPQRLEGANLRTLTTEWKIGKPNREPNMIRLKRAYDEPAKGDGLRVLVERLWPRGLSKDKLAIDLWLKDLAPSPDLRKWFGHDPEKWDEFRQRYWSELEQQGDLLVLLKHRTTEGTVTFVYAASDKNRNSAVALKAFLEERM